MKIVIFDRKILVRDICCTQPVFSISGKPWKSTAGEPGGRRCRISAPAACKNFCRPFLKRKRGLARFCAKFDWKKKHRTAPQYAALVCYLPGVHSWGHDKPGADINDRADWRRLFSPYLRLLRPIAIYSHSILFTNTRVTAFIYATVQFHQSDLK